jgi:hypothetical protein
MNPRIGRPKLDNPKTESIHLRLSKEDREIIDCYCKQENIPKTEAIRRGIRKLKDDIKK